jgi:Cu(I)/Ag(I) efflux system membrane fusion protein
VRSRARWVVGGLAVVLAAGALGVSIFLTRAEKPAATGAPPAEGRKVLYWRSPMDPTFISKAPGMDSMGMELVPVYEGEAAAGGEPGVVRIDPVTIQNIGVKTVVVARKPLSREIRTVGRITYDERLVRTISPKIGGWVERQHVNFTGQLVRVGERLLDIYSPELVSTQEEYLIALRFRRELAESDLPDAVRGSESLARAAETRLRYWDITDRQIRALRESGEITRTMALYAPFTGIVVARDVLEGGYVKPGQALYRIADISTVWVQADVYEYEAPWLTLGQQATMTLAYQPGVTYTGKVVYIYPYLKNMTRTLQVRMEFRNTKGFALKPDMWADVVIRSVPRTGLAVPIQAVIRTGTRDVAFVALDGGRFAPRELTLGAEAGDEFEVLDGLREGERVVTSAQFLINSESNLQAAIGKMLEPHGAQGAAAEAPHEGPPHTAVPQAGHMGGHTGHE